MEHRQSKKLLNSDVQCITCGYWFPRDRTEHYCPLLSGVVILQPAKESKEQ